MRAQVIVLAGPSGAGKSRLAERLGLPEDAIATLERLCLVLLRSLLEHQSADG